MPVKRNIKISGTIIPGLIKILSCYPNFGYSIEKKSDAIFLTVELASAQSLNELLRRLKNKKNRRGTVVEVITGGDYEGGQ